MSVNKNSSFVGPNNKFIPNSTVTENRGVIRTLDSKNIPQDSKAVKAEYNETKNRKYKLSSANQLAPNEGNAYVSKADDFLIDSKIKISVELVIKNDSILDQRFSGTIKNIINQIKKFALPDLNIQYPLHLSMSYNDKEIRKLQTYYSRIPQAICVLYFHILRSIEKQLVNKPKQLISSKLAADILNVQHESLLEFLKSKEIPYNQINNEICLRSSDLFEYEKNAKKVRSEALTQLIQSGI